MRRVFLLLFLIPFLSLGFAGLGADNVKALGREIILDAKVLEVEKATELEGLRIQMIKGEILEGEYKGSVKEIQVPLEKGFSRPVKVGDRIKVGLVSLGDETYFQFYDFSRSTSYIWLFVLFLILVVAFVGWKGLKTLIPSILLILFILLGLIPDFLTKVGFLFGSLMTIGMVSTVTAWIRLRHKLLTIIVLFSVIVCLLIAFSIFVGFSLTAYIVPFLGSITTVDEDLYIKVMDILFASSLFIPAGGVINASIQVSKYLLEEFGQATHLSIAAMLKEGLRISQKISAGELNNLIIMVIGISLAGIFLIKEQFPHLNYWDNGWVSLQVIYTISAGISILLITPITVFISAAVIALSRAKDRGGSQRRLGVSK